MVTMVIMAAWSWRRLTHGSCVAPYSDFADEDLHHKCGDSLGSRHTESCADPQVCLMAATRGRLCALEEEEEGGPTHDA